MQTSDEERDDWCYECDRPYDDCCCDDIWEEDDDLDEIQNKWSIVKNFTIRPDLTCEGFHNQFVICP